MRRLFTSPQTIAEYSDHLRRRLAGVLPPERIDEVVAETEAHLHDAADDLREEVDIYEQVAVRRFVGVGRLASGISRAWAPTYLRHAGTRPLQTLGALVALGTVAFFVAATTTQINLPEPLSAVVVFGGIGLCFALALAACRHQLHRFVTGGLALLILCTLWGGWKFALLPVGGRGYSPPGYGGLISRYNAPRLLTKNDEIYELTRQRTRLVQQGLRHFRADGVGDLLATAPTELRRPDGSVLIPTPGEIFPYDAVATKDPLRAQRAWRRDGPKQLNVDMRQLELLNTYQQAALNMIAAPRWRFDATAARLYGSQITTLLGALLLADLAGGALGTALLRLRRRRRHLAAA